MKKTEGVPLALFQGVCALRRVLASVAPDMVAEHPVGGFQCHHLGVPHTQTGAQRVVQRHNRDPFLTRKLLIHGNAAGLDMHDFRSFDIPSYAGFARKLLISRGIGPGFPPTRE